VLGVAGLAGAADAAFGEMAEGQRVAAQTAAALKSTGQAANVTAGQIDALADSIMRKTGIDDEAVKSSENMLLTFTKIRNEVGRGNDIFNQATMAVADLATRMSQGATPSAEALQTASIQLGKALNDPIKGLGSLRRVGIQFTDAQANLIKRLVESGQTLEAQKIILRELQTEFGASAVAAGQTLPGKLNILRETVLNLAGAIAGMLTPDIEKLVDRATAWVQNSENQKRVLDTVREAAQAVADVISALKGVMEGLNSITGSTKNTLKLLFDVFVAIKIAQFAAMLKNIGTQLGFIGTQAQVATGKAKVLRGVLGSIARIGVITIAIELILNKSAVDKFLKEHNLGILTKPLKDWPGEIGRGLGGRGIVPPPVVRGEVPSGKVPPRTPPVRGEAPGEKVPPRAAPPPPPTPRGGAAVEQRNKWFDAMIARAIFRAEDIPTLQGQIAELQRIGALITARIKATKDVTRRLNLEDQLRTVQRDIAGKQQQLAEGVESAANDAKAAAKDAAQAQAEAAQAIIDTLQLKIDRAALTKTLADDLAALKALQEHLRKRIRAEGETLELARLSLEVQQRIAGVLEQQAEEEEQARTAAQFRALGLTAAGEKPLPTIENLRKQLEQLQKRLAGTALGRRSRALFARISRVLAGDIKGKATPQIVAAIRDMFQKIRGELDQGMSGAAGPVTKWRVVNTDAILEGLGLSREQLLRARQRLARLGPGGTTPRPTRTGGAFGMGGAFGVMNFNAPVTVMANNPEQFMREMQRRKRRGAVSRTGPRAGQRGD
jgi:hypothetical protein